MTKIENEWPVKHLEMSEHQKLKITHWCDAVAYLGLILEVVNRDNKQLGTCSTTVNGQYHRFALNVAGDHDVRGSNKDEFTEERLGGDIPLEPRVKVTYSILYRAAPLLRPWSLIMATWALL